MPWFYFVKHQSIILDVVIGILDPANWGRIRNRHPMSKPRWDGARHAHFPDHGLAMDAAATAPSSSNPSFSASGTAAARRGRRRPSAPPHPHLLDPPRAVISSPAVLPDAASAAAANGCGPLGEVHGDLHPHVSPFPSQLILCQCSELLGWSECSFGFGGCYRCCLRRGAPSPSRSRRSPGSGGEVRRNHHLNGLFPAIFGHIVLCSSPFPNKLVIY
jgi:hypothetical protein